MKTFAYDLKRWKPFFFTIWSGQSASLLGSRLVDFALVWYMTTTTGSALVLTTASVVGMLPMIAAPVFGSLVDRRSRRGVMIAADAVIAAFTLLIALLFAVGRIQIWHLYVLLFIRSMAGTAQGLGMIASTSLMVPEEQLSRVAGMNQTLNGAISIAAPPLGALLMTVMPIYSILLIDIATALFAILPLAFIRIPEIAGKAEPAPGPSQAAGLRLFDDIRQGFRYLLASRGLIVLVLLVLLVNFLAAPIPTLLPLVVTQIFKGGALQLGWLEGASGAGIIAGGLLLSTWGGFKRRIFTLLGGIILFGLSALILGATPPGVFGVAVGAAFLFGFSNPFTDGSFMAILQARVNPELQGRVFSVVLSLAKVAVPLALLLSGGLAELLGLRFWYLAAGALIIAAGLAALCSSALTRLEEEQQPAAKNALLEPSERAA